MLTSQVSALFNPLAGLPEAQGDTIDVRIGSVPMPGDLAALFQHEQAGIHSARVVIIDAGSLSIGETEVAAIMRVVSMGVRVVLSSPHPIRGFPPLTVLHERDFNRAVVASLYGLPPHSKAVLISPLPEDSPVLKGLIRLALRWRSSEQDSLGDFSSMPH